MRGSRASCSMARISTGPSSATTTVRTRRNSSWMRKLSKLPFGFSVGIRTTCVKGDVQMNVNSQTVISLGAGESDSLELKLANRTACVGVVGLGYVGLPLSLLFADAGFRVTGFEVDAQKVEKLSRGESYIYRVPSTEVQLARMKQFSATVDYSVIAGMDAVIICVPTPLNEQREPDLSYIINTAEAIAPHLRAGQLVVLESTTYPGTTEEVLVPILERGNKAGLKAARKGDTGTNTFYVAFSPEREDPGNQSVARADIPKVVGGLDQQASALAASLYGAVF